MSPNPICVRWRTDDEITLAHPAKQERRRIQQPQAPELDVPFHGMHIPNADH